MSTKQSYLDRVQGKLQDKAEKSGADKNSGVNYYPEVGSTKIRILPPVNEDDNPLPYFSHYYHFIPEDPNNIGNSSGSYLWALKRYNVSGIEKLCPVCSAVKQWYAVGRKNDDKQLLKYGASMKLKRQYFFNVLLLDEPDPARKLRILVDTSNEGKLTRIICSLMGIPFFKDIEDNWVDEDSKNIDPDKKVFDLVDPEVGHDFKIIKKKIGDAPWQISYEESFVIETPRALTPEERKLSEQRPDLKKIIEYEQDYDKVKAIMSDFIMEDDGDDDDHHSQSNSSNENIPKPQTSTKPDEVENEEELDKPLDELE